MQLGDDAGQRLAGIAGREEYDLHVRMQRLEAFLDGLGRPGRERIVRVHDQTLLRGLRGLPARQSRAREGQQHGGQHQQTTGTKNGVQHKKEPPTKVIEVP